MQAATQNRNAVFFVFASLLVLAAIAAAFWQQPYILGIPFIILISFFLVTRLHYLFCLLVISIPWSIEYTFNQSLGTDLPDEPLMLLTSFAVIIWAVQHHKNLLKKPAIHPILWILFLQVLWVIITLVTSTNPLVSFKYLLAKSWYVLAFAGAPLILFRNAGYLKKSFFGLFYSMLAVLIVILVRHAFTGFTFSGINPSLQPFFRNHVNYSSLLVCMVPLCIAAMQLSAYKRMKFFFSAILLLLLFAVITSYARGAWLALLTGLSTYGLLRKKALFITFILMIVFALGTVFWFTNNDRYLRYAPDYKSTIFHSDFTQHLVATYQMKDVSNAERFYRWIAGIRMIKDSWKTGFGPTTFYDNYRSYSLPIFKTWVSNNPEHSTVHNYFLLMIIEQGAIGLLLMLLLLGYMFYTAQKIYHRTQDAFWKIMIAAISAILVMICTVNFLSDLIETDKIGSVFYICLASLVIADIKTKSKSLLAIAS